MAYLCFSFISYCIKQCRIVYKKSVLSKKNSIIPSFNHKISYSSVYVDPLKIYFKSNIMEKYKSSNCRADKQLLSENWQYKIHGKKKSTNF
jgi:hypothetical protein